MANFKKIKAADKGDPPPAAAITENLAKPPREANEPKTRLEFLVEQSLFDEFSDEAARLFGRKHGAKIKLFRAIWEAHQSGK